MAEIDLIPGEYRRQRWLSAWSRQLLISVAVVLTICLLPLAALSLRVKSLRESETLLRQQRAVTEQQRDELKALDAQKQTLLAQLQLLGSLRSGAPAQSIFLTIDRALGNADLWFLDWQFRRAGVRVPEGQPRSVETGYFIVIPDASPDGQEQTWRVETHMTIKGQARDHEALSEFVNGLYAQPEVAKVDVQRTELSRLGEHDVVQFDLAIVLTGESQA